MARLTFHLSEKDKKIVEERAKAVGIPASRYCMLAVTGRARRNKLKVDHGRSPGREKW